MLIEPPFPNAMGMAIPALVNTNWSTSISPALRTLVPRRTSSTDVPAALFARNVPPFTTTRLLVEPGWKPTKRAR